MSRALYGFRKIWIPLCALVLSGAAAAQQASSALEACAAITDRADRLDCYDRIAAGAPAAGTVPPAASAPERRTETVTAPATPPPAEAPAAPPSRQRAESSAAAPGDDSDAAGEVADADLPTLRAEGRGRARPESGAAAVSILVVRRVENISGLSVFVTDDGTIFDQISARAGRYPDTPFLAEIEPASKNSYWLRTARKSPPVRIVERE